MATDNKPPHEMLDLDSWKIMKVIAEQQEITTTEIKQKTDLEKNHRILYRTRKLEELDWIRIHQAGNKSGGVCPPNHYTLVRHKLSEYLDAKPDLDDMTIDERLHQVEEKIDKLDGGLEETILQLKIEVSAIKNYLLQELNINESELMEFNLDHSTDEPSK